MTPLLSCKRSLQQFMPLYSMGCSPPPGVLFSVMLNQHYKASRLSIPPLIAWITSDIGIEGNEAADRSARQALMKPDIDKNIPMSKARTRRTTKQTARNIYETIERLNPTRSVSLHQHVVLSTRDRTHRTAHHV